MFSSLRKFLFFSKDAIDFKRKKMVWVRPYFEIKTKNGKTADFFQNTDTVENLFEVKKVYKTNKGFFCSFEKKQGFKYDLEIEKKENSFKIQGHIIILPLKGFKKILKDYEVLFLAIKKELEKSVVVVQHHYKLEFFSKKSEVSHLLKTQNINHLEKELYKNI